MNRKEFGELCRAEMAKWSLTEWEYGYRNFKRKLGLCVHHEKVLYFSLPFVDNNPVELLLDTIRHEIGHALVGPGYGHGPEWKRLAPHVGYIPKRCADSDSLVLPPKPWVINCNCPIKPGWYRRPRGYSYQCNRCGVKNLQPIRISG